MWQYDQQKYRIRSSRVRPVDGIASEADSIIIVGINFGIRCAANEISRLTPSDGTRSELM